ncbi:MAG TPA: metallophosphoesterase [Amaricoccus sp.]|nr:metallophosphoesterase [Amaricoccus sp.]
MRIAQITDPHMTAGPPEPGGYDAAAALAAVLAAVDRLAPDVVLLTGDLAADGRPEEYRRLCAVLAASRTPMLAVPGNHDHRETFAGELAGSAIAIGEGPGLWLERDDGPVRLLGLDTLGAGGSDVGLLGDAQLAWVADRLGRDDPRPVLIFMHHPPFPVGLPLDWTRCADGDALARLVEAHPRVLAVVCGHLHRAARLAWAGSIGGVCPPVAWEVPLDLPAGTPPYLVPQSPAFQLHVADPGLGLVSHTQHVTMNGFSAAADRPSLAPMDGNR